MSSHFPLIETFSVKKRIGKADIEDVLKRLDRLTKEVARMADAQLLKVTDMIEYEVREVVDNVLATIGWPASTIEGCRR